MERRGAGLERRAPARYFACMPAQFAHILSGEEALRAADPAFAQAVLSDRERGAWFRLGCQGPDLFYHNQRTMPSGLHYGSLAHRRNYGLLVEGALRELLGHEGGREGAMGGPAAGGSGAFDAAQAWLLGFACHAALDRALHPYVVYRAGWALPGRPETEAFRSAHAFLERLLDLGLLAATRGQEAAAFGLGAALPRPDAPDFREAAAAVRALLSAGLREAFPRAAGGDALLGSRIANALEDGLGFLRATDPAHTRGAGPEFLRRQAEQAGPRQIALLYPDEIPAGLDFMNRRRETWLHPAGDGRSSDEGVLELFSRGTEEARRALAALLEAFAREAGRHPPAPAALRAPPPPRAHARRARAATGGHRGPFDALTLPPGTARMGP